MTQGMKSCYGVWHRGWRVAMGDDTGDEELLWGMTQGMKCCMNGDDTGDEVLLGWDDIEDEKLLRGGGGGWGGTQGIRCCQDADFFEWRRQRVMCCYKDRDTEDEVLLTREYKENEMLPGRRWDGGLGLACRGGGGGGRRELGVANVVWTQRIDVLLGWYVHRRSVARIERIQRMKFY